MSSSHSNLKRLLRTASVALYLIAASSTANAQMSVALQQGLEFGTIGGDADASGTVTVQAKKNAGKSVGGAVFDFGGNHQAAKFAVTNGVAHGDVVVTLPSSVVIDAGGGLTATITNLTFNGTNPVSLSNKGKATIWVGGTLSVGAGQQAGSYSNSFTISVDPL